MLDTPFTSIPVSWKTLLKHVHVTNQALDLKHILSEKENADLFSRTSTLSKKAILKEILGENSEFIQPILDSVSKMSVDNAGQFICT